jgi:molybdenum storage protein
MQDPTTHPDAEFIKEITASELEAMNLENLVIEPMVIELLKDAAHVKEIRIINCHIKGNIEKAIKGKNVGTVIRAA